MSDATRIHPDDEILRCAACDWFTDRLEATRRLFNTNRCARCGGPLDRVTGKGFEHIKVEERDE